MKFILGMLTGIIISALLFLFFFKKQANNNALSANENTEEVVNESTSSAKLTNGFIQFYDRFHSDSAYQMEHIVFPLEGIPAGLEDGVIPENFSWQKEDWKLHKLFDGSDGKFVQTLDEVGNALVIDQIKDAAGDYGMQRRFAKMGDEWFLIYYAGINALVKEENSVE